MIEYYCIKCNQLKQCDKLPRMKKWFICQSCEPPTLEETRDILKTSLAEIDRKLILDATCGGDMMWFIILDKPPATIEWE